MTVFLTVALPLVNVSSELMDVFVPPVVPLTILNIVSMKRVARNVEFLMAEIFEEFILLIF